MPDVAVESPKQIDLLDPKSPATSATSDVPVIETRPDAQQKPAAADKAETVESATTEPPESASAEPEAPKVKGVQKRLDELTRNWREEQRAREATQTQLDRTLALLETAMKGKPEQVATDDAEPAEPDVAKYTDQTAYNTDYRKYLKDVAAYAGRQAARETTKKSVEDSEKQRQEESFRKQRDSYRERVTKAREKYPDYDAVTTADNVPFTKHMTEAIVEAEHGTDVAYYLATNLEEANRIARLSPRSQFIELGYLTAQFRQAAKEEVKAPAPRAPAPIKPLGTATRGTGVTSTGEPDMESYAAKRSAQLAAERRPGGRR